MEVEVEVELRNEDGAAVPIHDKRNLRARVHCVLQESVSFGRRLIKQEGLISCNAMSCSP